MYYVLITLPTEGYVTMATYRAFGTLPEAEAYLATVHPAYAPFIAARVSRPQAPEKTA